MFEEEYIRLVIGPKLLPLCAKCSSMQEVCSEFRDQWGFTLNRTRALRWLDVLGITPKKQTLFVGLAPVVSRPEPAMIDLGPGPDTSAPPIDVPGQAHFPGFTNMAPPGSMFSNVPLPGFSE